MNENKTNQTVVEPISEELDMEVQYCSPTHCLYDCPPYAPNMCSSLLSTNL